jgi:hypothetical protein
VRELFKVAAPSLEIVDKHADFKKCTAHLQPFRICFPEKGPKYENVGSKLSHHQSLSEWATSGLKEKMSFTLVFDVFSAKIALGA